MLESNELAEDQGRVCEESDGEGRREGREVKAHLGVPKTNRLVPRAREHEMPSRSLLGSRDVPEG